MKAIYRGRIRMDAKSAFEKDALAKVKELGCTLEVVDSRNINDPLFEVLPPEGQLFDDELTGLLCFDFQDVLERLKTVSLVPEFVD